MAHQAAANHSIQTQFDDGTAEADVRTEQKTDPSLQEAWERATGSWTRQRLRGGGWSTLSLKNAYYYTVQVTVLHSKLLSLVEVVPHHVLGIWSPTPALYLLWFIPGISHHLVWI